MDELLNLEELFEVVEQPAYSKEVLISLQKKYDMSTEEFLRYYNQDMLLSIPPKDVSYWLFHWEQFVYAEGNVSELMVDFFDYSSDNWTSQNFYDNPLISKQVDNNIEEVKMTSSFFGKIPI